LHPAQDGENAIPPSVSCEIWLNLAVDPREGTPATSDFDAPRHCSIDPAGNWLRPVDSRPAGTNQLIVKTYESYPPITPATNRGEIFDGKSVKDDGDRKTCENPHDTPEFFFTATN
jgi:hypothetical protein